MSRRDPSTKKREILDAVERVLTRDGVPGLGVNAIAKEAGVGKPLIYRYFGGLSELMSEFGHDANFWFGQEDVVAEAERMTDGDMPEDFGSMIRLVVLCYARILRQRPVLQEVLVSELIAQNIDVKPLAQARREAAKAAVAEFVGDAQPPEDVDTEAVTAILVAAFQYMILRSRIFDDFFGVPIDTDEDWKRCEKAMTFIIDRVYGSAADRAGKAP